MKFHGCIFALIFFCFIFTSNSASDREIDDNSSGRFFISEIFNKYGNKQFISYEGFEHLLENLGLGKLKFEMNHDVSMHRINGTFLEFHDELSLHRHDHDSVKTDRNSTRTSFQNEKTSASRRRRNLTPNERDGVKSIKQRCLTPQDILITFGLEPHHDVAISTDKYLQICPAIIYELDQKLCQEEREDGASRSRDSRDYYLVWIYASASVLVMGVSGMLCVLVVPLMGNTSGTSSLLQFLVSVAAGTLCGDALIHLLPQVFSQIEESGFEMASVHKGSSALLAIFLFFIIESTLNECKAKREMGKKLKELDVMLAGEEVQKLHHLSHSHNGGSVESIAWMAILGDVLHNVTDGLSIGAAFTTRLSAGFASSIAIFCHELPHELGDYAILLASGMSVKKSLFYNILSSAFSLMGMVAGILLGEFRNASAWINAVTAGSFLYVALTDLLPGMKAMSAGSDWKNFAVQILGVFSGGILMLAIALYEDEIEFVLS